MSGLESRQCWFRGTSTRESVRFCELATLRVCSHNRQASACGSISQPACAWGRDLPAASPASTRRCADAAQQPCCGRRSHQRPDSHRGLQYMAWQNGARQTWSPAGCLGPVAQYATLATTGSAGAGGLDGALTGACCRASTVQGGCVPEALQGPALHLDVGWLEDHLCERLHGSKPPAGQRLARTQRLRTEP